MDAWTSIVKAALLGTANGFTPPSTSDALRETLAGIPTDDREDSLLSAAAVLGITKLAGRIPNKLDKMGDASAAESLNLLSEAASVFLKRILSGEHENVLPEFLELTASQKRIVPPETLPALLGLGKHKLRKYVLPVIGERGKWLAKHNSSWAYALGREDENDIWETGTRLERVDYLERLRGADSKHALELIQSTWDQDSHEERAAFIETFAKGLSMADEPFLESCLDDSRKEVRDAALNLLIRLPGSRHAERVAARLLPLLEYKSSRLRGDSLRVTLPEEMAADAKRDGISGVSLHRALGKQANLLAQMISLLHPSFWSQTWEQSPEKILQMALKTKWKEALMIGWLLATERSQDPNWAGAIAEIMVKQTTGWESFADVDLRGIVKLIPMAKFETLAKASLRKEELHNRHPMLLLLEAYETAWSEALARTVMTIAQSQAGKTQGKLMQDLPVFALRIPVSLTETFIKGWPEDTKGWETWIDRFCAVLRFRRDMTDALRR
jgi:Family of unknown function (DUF5691)